MSMFSPKKIYLDYAATTPVLREVRKEMEKYFSKDFYNPSSIYGEGVRMKKDLEFFRTRIARILETAHKDIIFTGSGTESDNLAILGVFEAAKGKIEKPHIIISTIEHPGVKEAAKEVIRRGGEVTEIKVDQNGLIDPKEIIENIKDSTVLVSIILASNEIGTIEPISKIGRLIKEYRKNKNSIYPFFHSDGSQAANYIRVTLPSLSLDLLTLDASKIYGPKGIGLLVLRPGVLIHPIIFGGGQERGLRSGTESLALISGFTYALEIVNKSRDKEAERLNGLKENFIKELKNNIPNIIINTPEDSLPNIISVSYKEMLAEFVAIKFDAEGIMVSTGSSCGNIKDSGGTSSMVALGKPELRESTIRFSLGKFTKKKDLIKTIKIFKRIMQS